jgi:hypothetical protein
VERVPALLGALIMAGHKSDKTFGEDPIGFLAFLGGMGDDMAAAQVIAALPEPARALVAEHFAAEDLDLSREMFMSWCTEPNPPTPEPVTLAQFVAAIDEAWALRIAEVIAKLPNRKTRTRVAEHFAAHWPIGDHADEDTGASAEDMFLANCEV